MKIKTGKKKKCLCEIWSRVFPTPLFLPPIFRFCASLDRLSSKWSKLEPRPSLSSSLVVKRERERENLVGPDHMTTENLGGQKMEWQRGVAKSRNCDCNNFTVSGRECKKVVLPKCAALANDQAKANHTGSILGSWITSKKGFVHSGYSSLSSTFRLCNSICFKNTATIYVHEEELCSCYRCQVAPQWGDLPYLVCRPWKCENVTGNDQEWPSWIWKIRGKI